MRTDTLIEKVRLNLSLPRVENRFSDETILDLANDEIQSSILPWMFSLREDFLVEEEDISISEFLNGFSFPPYTSGRAIKDLWYSSNQQDWKPLIRISLDESWRYQDSAVQDPRGFLLKGDQIELLPLPSGNSTGFLRLFIHVLPNELVDVSRGFAIQSFVDFETISLSTIPAFFQVGTRVDAISFLPDFRVKRRSLEILTVDSALKQITLAGFSATEPISQFLSLQDWICVTGETVVTPLPVEINQLLIQSIAIRILESQNSPQQLTLALERFNRLKIQLRDILSPRAENRLLKFRPNYPFIRSRINYY